MHRPFRPGGQLRPPEALSAWRWLLIVAALLAPGCVIDPGRREIAVFRLAEGSRRYTYNPLGDLLELLLVPLAPLVVPVVLIADGPSQALAAWLIFLPGFNAEKLAFESELAPAWEAMERDHTTAELLAELGRAEGRTTAVAARCADFPGIHWLKQGSIPYTRGELARRLAAWVAPHLVERSGARLLACSPSGWLPGVAQGSCASLDTVPHLIGPEALEGPNPIVERRGAVLVLGRGDAKPPPLADLVHDLRTASVGEATDPSEPRVTLFARRAPLRWIASRLSETGRPVEVDPTIAEQQVSFHLEESPFSQAVAIVAFAAGCDLRREGDGVRLLPAAKAPPLVTGSIRGADPADALDLIGRAAGVAVEHADALSGRVSLDLRRVSAGPALACAVELLGATVETSGARAVVVRGGGPMERPPSRVEAQSGPRAPGGHALKSALALVDQRVDAALSGSSRPDRDWSRRLAALLAAGGEPAHARIAARLAAWDRRWLPELRAEVARVLARQRGVTALDRLKTSLGQRRPLEALEGLPDLRALASELRAHDPAGTDALEQAADELRDEAEAGAHLLARSEGRLQGVLLGDGCQSLALIDGAVLAEGERLVDRVGLVRADVVLDEIHADHVVVRSGGGEVRIHLESP